MIAAKRPKTQGRRASRALAVSLLLVAAPVALWLPAGCSTLSQVAAPRPGQEIEGDWQSPCNARMGRSGTLHLSLEADSQGIGGEARMAGNSCLPGAPFRGTYAGGELKGEAQANGTRLELRLRRDGETLFGTYRFLAGDCVGEWGALMATRE